MMLAKMLEASVWVGSDHGILTTFNTRIGIDLRSDLNDEIAPL